VSVVVPSARASNPRRNRRAGAVVQAAVTVVFFVVVLKEVDRTVLVLALIEVVLVTSSPWTIVVLVTVDPFCEEVWYTVTRVPWLTELTIGAGE